MLKKTWKAFIYMPGQPSKNVLHVIKKMQSDLCGRTTIWEGGRDTAVKGA